MQFEFTVFHQFHIPIKLIHPAFGSLNANQQYIQNLYTSRTNVTENSLDLTNRKESSPRGPTPTKIAYKISNHS